MCRVDTVSIVLAALIARCYVVESLVLLSPTGSRSSVTVSGLHSPPPPLHHYCRPSPTIHRRRTTHAPIRETKSFLSTRMTTEPTEADSLLPSSVTASAAVRESSVSQSLSTGQKILDLAIPAAGALLIDPLMTLVDTAFVGRFTIVTAANDGSAAAAAVTAAAPLAGMGSAAALLTFGFYLCNFLCTATTPLVARERASGRPDQAVILGGQVLSLALLLGGLLTIVLWSCQGPLLQLMGTDRTGEAANSYAVSFLSVRALAAPAVLCIEAATGILRGYLDTKTPIVVLIVANVINFVLDVILIVLLGLGPMGAAIATTTAEWIGAALFLAVLAGKLPAAGGALGSRGGGGSGGSGGQQDNESIARLEPSINDNSAASLSLPPVAIVPILSIPRWDSVQPLMVASSSVFLRTLVLQASLSAAAAMAARGGVHFQDVMTGSSSSATAAVVAVETAASSIAAHQIGIQLWLLCSFLCDSLAAASQGLVADALGRQDSDSVLDVSKTIFAYSFTLGMALALVLQIGTSTHWLVDLFTEDPMTQAALGRILPLIVVAQPLNALVFAADGVLQGATEFPFQARAMLLSGLTAVATFLALETLGSDVDTLVHVWVALIALQTMRGLTSLWKLMDSNGPINLLSMKEQS
jgi:Na+-driven multidrug efflux pump